MKKVYISGPMTGLPGLNRRAFFVAETYLKKLGYRVINPVRIGDGLDASGNLNGIPEKDKYIHYLRADLAEVPCCDAIYMLKGWEHSDGAGKEFVLAKFCELELMFQRDWDKE